VAEAGVPIALLPSGEYVARAVIFENGRKVGQVVRPFRIARAAGATAVRGPAAAPLAPAAPIPFASRTETFDKAAVLTPPVLGFFFDRMSAAASASAAAVRPAIAGVLGGRYDEAMRSLETAGDDQLAAGFVKGIVLLHGGDLTGAAARFNGALRADPQFYAAAFYLGACQAAAGDDREAAKTWQSSLITDPAAPFVYTLLGDSLLRLRDLDRAIDVLAEARTLWPADDQVAQRLASALVTANKPADAMQVLEPYIAAHPADHERLLLALRALYEARAAGSAVRTREEDKALFTRYADAYAAAGGPQRALVGEWRKYLEKPDI
jgi:tetratricopeptide (TPR) repeat protein